MEEILVDIEQQEALSEDIASDVIKALWQQRIGKKIANYGVMISEGRNNALPRLKKLLEDTENGFTPDELGEEIPKDLETLLSLTSNENRYQFNIPSLSRKVYGIGKGEFGIGFARPETGKTAFVVSLACGPNGFCQQGANVLYLGNEEDPQRTMLRAYSAYTGMDREAIVDFPELAVQKFQEISNNITMVGIQDWYIEQVEALIERKSPDIVLIDQYDKVKMHSDSKGHELLGELYVELRSMARRQDVVLFGLSQASADAEGHTILSPDKMEGSKTRKYAEADLIIGIGKYDDRADGTPEPIRFLTIGKNKLSGWHGTIPVKFDQELSRYEA